MSNMQYIGIVGWSWHIVAAVSRLHQQTRAVEILAIADPSDEAFAYGRDVLGLKHVFREPAALYSLHQLDTIIVCSPAECHLEHVTKALQSGTNVIVDFPLASNVADCLALEQVVRRYPSQQTLLCFPRRFDQDLQRLQKTVAQGSLGDIISISIENYEALPANFFAESAARSASKGIFMDLTIQDVDLVHWLTGQLFTSVYATGSAKKYPALASGNDADTAQITATLEHGTIVSLLTSRTGSKPDGYRLQIVGAAGTLSYTSRASQIEASSIELLQAVESSEPSEAKLYQASLRYYLSETLHGAKLPHSVQVGTKATKVAVGMTKSFVLGEVIKID